MSNFLTNYISDDQSSGCDTHDTERTSISLNHSDTNSSDFDEIVIVSSSDDDDSILSTITYSDLDSDLDSENIYDEINQLDYDHFYSEKENNKYYIGMYQYDDIYNTLLLSTSISPSVYFRYSYKECSRYLYYYGICQNARPSVDIMQLQITEDGVFTVIIKTFWLKIIQRKWKKVFRVRQQIINKRQNPGALLHREIIGKWQQDISYLPGISGLMV